jgi:hypothetical protein
MAYYVYAANEDARLLSTMLLMASQELSEQAFRLIMLNEKYKALLNRTLNVREGRLRLELWVDKPRSLFNTHNGYYHVKIRGRSERNYVAGKIRKHIKYIDHRNGQIYIPKRNTNHDKGSIGEDCWLRGGLTRQKSIQPLNHMPLMM